MKVKDIPKLCVDCGKKATYECTNCGELYCSACEDLYGGECQECEPPRLVKIKKVRGSHT
jgi:hypothetical protein